MSDLTVQDNPEEPKKSVVQASAENVVGGERIIQFRGRAMIMRPQPYPHFVPLRKEEFDKIAYPILGGVTRSRMNDVFSYICNTAEDLTGWEDYISFGAELHPENVAADTDLAFLIENKPTVWDMAELRITRDVDTEQTVWRSPHPRLHKAPDAPVPWILDLADGDMGVYGDIMQSIAPIIMKQKPDGVIWWVGDGANGKSTLMDALYRIFPGQFASINVKRLTDGRDTPSLNGQLANIVKESSEGRIDDTEIYKNIGTHENFRVHKFNSQDDIEIRGNLHHVFSANHIPVFNDKGHSARRRTFIIPFNARFESDPTFESRTFTPQMFAHLVSEMMKYAQLLRKQGYKYKWSPTTLAAKSNYDSNANSTEEYAADTVKRGVVAIANFRVVQWDYEEWCAQNGFTPLGLHALTRAFQNLGFERLSTRFGDKTPKIWRLSHIEAADMVPYGLKMEGVYTVLGFEEEADPEPVQLPLTTTETTTVPPEPPKEQTPKKEWKW